MAEIDSLDEKRHFAGKLAYGSVPVVENEEDDFVVVGRGERPSLRDLLRNKYVQMGLVTLAVVVLLLYGKGNSQSIIVSTLPDQLIDGSLGKSHQKLEEYQVPHFYEDQLVDHFSDDGDTYSNRYYVSSEHWKGPGFPIIVVLGGEGSVNEVFYPFVRRDLAKRLGAYVLQTEHRFYGESFPNKGGTKKLPTNDELKRLHSPDQALLDYVQIIQHFQRKLGCSTDRRASKNYCPIITVGASYPGFLSAMMRLVYPELVDISYASSAPLLLYAQARDQFVYYDYVTQVAERASPGCAHAYKTTLFQVKQEILTMSIPKAAKKLGICSNIPKYIKTPEQFAFTLTMMAGFFNAEANMGYHPPGDPNTDLIQGCKAFQQPEKSPMERFADFFVVKTATRSWHPREPCYDLHWDLPAGSNATIVGADWSGLFPPAGRAMIWEFQNCRDLIVRLGFGPNSMFLEQPLDLGWLRDHCQARFEVDPEPRRLVDKWHFDDLVGHGGSYILFTNGVNDAWASLSYTQDLSDTIVAVNFPSGAHHSELNGRLDDDHEFEDIKQGRKTIATILEQWVGLVKQGATVIN
jgi:pimeloyl-ACP methyl ester carboxylesterase